MNASFVPALSIVGGLTAVGAVMVSAIGWLQRPEPGRLRQIWIKLGLQMLIMAGFVSTGALGPYALAPAAVFIAFRAWFELTRSLEGKYGPIASRGLLVVLGACVPLGGFSGRPESAFLLAFVGTWSALAWPMLATRKPPPLHGVLLAAFGMTFISLPLGLLVVLAQETYGAYAFFIILLMSHDGFAEGFGRLFGRKALWPDISPGKTLGGTIGGIFACLALGFGLRFLVPQWPVPVVLLVSAGVVAMGAIGDLIASSIKRECGIKDFGRILPTHGGVLDRVDSLLFTVPIFFAAVRFFEETSR